MKKLIYILPLLAGWLSVACSSSGGADSATPVTFTTEIQTRAVAGGVMSEFASGDAMTIFRTPTSSIQNTTVTVYEARYGGTNWSVAPAATLGGGEEAYFMATYPAVSATGGAAPSPESIPVKVADQVDVLYSGSGIKATEAQPSVAFKMHHAMAMMAFNIQSYVGGKLTQIKIGNDKFPVEGELRVTRGSITATSYGAYTKQFNATLMPQGWTTDHPSIFVIPFVVPAEGLPVELTIDGKAYALTIPGMRITLSNKYVFYFTHTEAGLIFEEDKTETVELMAETAPIVSDPYSYVQIRHKNNSFVVPTISGTGMRGMIYWGDETSAAYAAGASHEYKGAGPFTLKVDAWNAATIQIPSVAGIEEIDLSKF